MCNAKQEFFSHCKGKGGIVAAIVQYDDYDCQSASGKENKEVKLAPNYSDEQFRLFINALDFDYDSGYGIQELFGVIWFEDSWSTRAEYDGAEWWENHIRPALDSYF